MKPIKKIELKDAKILSDMDMKNIAGGYTSSSTDDPCPGRKDKESCEKAATCYVTLTTYDGKTVTSKGSCDWNDTLKMCGCVASTPVLNP